MTEINSNSILLSKDYKNNRTKLKFRCSCGEIFERTYSNIQNRKSCQCISCGHKKGWHDVRRKDNYYTNLKLDFLKYGYKVIDKNKNLKCKDKVLVENNDGYRDYINIRNARLGKNFSVFSIKFNEDNLLYNLNKFSKINNINTKIINYSYINNIIRIECICKCGEHYFTNVGDFTTQNRFFCKKCTKHQSINERIVKIFLIKENIVFLEQKKFIDCRSDITNYLLPFDFYLPGYNVCIEVDGKQHYEPTRIRGISEKLAEEAYKKTLYNDNIKNKYCYNHDINLLRISYLDIHNETYKSLIKSVIK